MRSFLVVLLALAVSSAHAGVQEGLAAKRRGDYGAAYREFVPLAEAGDVRAMTTAALLIQEGGKGLPQNYGKAMLWHLRALEKGDGDAVNISESCIAMA